MIKRDSKKKLYEYDNAAPDSMLIEITINARFIQCSNLAPSSIVTFQDDSGF